MELNRKNAMKKWEESFGRDISTVDFAGRKIQKGAYQQLTSTFGWVLVPVLPKSAGGHIELNNLMCVHVRTAEEKSDDYPTFKAGDVRYNIVSQNGKWTVEQSDDDEAIAEQEAMVADAIMKWKELYGDADTVADFCGREMVKAQFLSDSEGAWKIAPYVTSRPAENKNFYIANVKSVEEAYGKTAFRANGRAFTLNKENGAYRFKESAVKPQRRSFHPGNPIAVAEKIDRSIEEFAGLTETGIWLDFIMVSAVIEAGVPEYVGAAFSDTVSYILREQVGPCISSEVSGLTDENGCYHAFLSFRYNCPQISDMQRVFSAAMLLNTYSTMLVEKFGLKMFKVYNYANSFPGTQVQYTNSFLANGNPAFKALLGAFFGSEVGLYEGEPDVTLYVSRGIVYNIRELAEVHSEEEAVYFTDAELTEHNYIYTGLREMIASCLEPSPEPEMPQELAFRAEQEQHETEDTDDSAQIDMFEEMSEDTVSDTEIVVNKEAAVDTEEAENSEAVTSPIQQETAEEPIAEEVAAEAQLAPEAQSYEQTSYTDEPEEERSSASIFDSLFFSPSNETENKAVETLSEVPVASESSNAQDEEKAEDTDGEVYFDLDVDE